MTDSEDNPSFSSIPSEDDEVLSTATILRSKGKNSLSKMIMNEKPIDDSKEPTKSQPQKQPLQKTQPTIKTSINTKRNELSSQPQQPPNKKPKITSVNEKPVVIHHDFLRSNKSKLGITKQQLSILSNANRTSSNQQNQPVTKVITKRIAAVPISKSSSSSSVTAASSRINSRITTKRTATTLTGINRFSSNNNNSTNIRKSTLSTVSSSRQSLLRRNTSIHQTSTLKKDESKDEIILKELGSIKNAVIEIKSKINLAAMPSSSLHNNTLSSSSSSSITTQNSENGIIISEEESLMNKKMIESLQNDKLKLLSENGQLEVTIGTLKSRQSAMEMEIEQYKSVAKTRQAEIERISIEKTDAMKKTSIAEQRISQLEELFKSEKGQNALLQTTLNARDASIHEMKAKIAEYEMIRRRLHNEVQELKGNIRVFCRVRPPLSTSERKENSIFTYNDMDPGQIEVSEPTLSVRGEKQVRKYEFNYDRVFGPGTSQDDIFEELSQLVQSALDGYSCCVFAYGQTGSGKTYTMEGPSNASGEALFAAESPERGIIPRAVEQIFTSVCRLKECGWEYTIEVSFLEVYNEQLRDLLLVKEASQSQPLQLTTSEDSVSVQGCRIVGVSAPNEVYSLLDIARKNRVVAETKYNEHSSRSHSIFRLHIRGHNSKRGETVTSLLNLVDLAGSERLDAGHNKAERQKETQNINKSLSNLRNVITALAESKKHVPYRESVLTRLLQNSLEKKAKMLMFVNVSPSISSVGQTLNALRFASTANKCHIGTVQRQAFNDK